MKTTRRNAVSVSGPHHGRPMMFATVSAATRTCGVSSRRRSRILQCADDVIAPPPVGDYVHRRTRGSTLVAMNVTGHRPNLSAPEETVAAIRAYL
jgi:sigma-B regulation protein RsbQ